MSRDTQGDRGSTVDGAIGRRDGCSDSPCGVVHHKNPLPILVVAQRSRSDCLRAGEGDNLNTSGDGVRRRWIDDPRPDVEIVPDLGHGTFHPGRAVGGPDHVARGRGRGRATAAHRGARDAGAVVAQDLAAGRLGPQRQRAVGEVEHPRDPFGEGFTHGRSPVGCCPGSARPSHCQPPRTARSRPGAAHSRWPAPRRGPSRRRW